MDVLVAFALFTIALLIAGYYVWSVPEQQASDALTTRLRELRTQTRAGASRTPSDLIQREHRGPFAFLGDFVSWLGVMRRLQAYIVQANLTYRAADVVGLSIAITLVFFLFFGLVGLRLLALRALISLLLGAIPIAYIRHKRSKRLRKFEEMLPDAIDLFTRTMRSGHNIHSGLETIASETADPVRMEFKKLMEQLALGAPLETALHDLGERIPVIDLKFFITGLVLQRQTGANMVAVLENLSLLVRERLNMAARMQAHTAQQRFSAGLLCGLPFVVALGFWILKPEYIDLLYSDPIGSKFLTYAIVSEIIGILVIRRMANVRF
jgi:tight adherence protein B